MKLIDAACRTALRIAYPILFNGCRLLRIRLRGVFVFIWHEDALLLVKNSYKPAHSLPGGLLKRHESPLDGAVRETAEEVGVTLQRDQLTIVEDALDETGGTSYMTEIRLAERPAITIDHREIVWAEFVPLAEARGMHLHKHVRAYLERHYPEPPTEGG